MLEKANGDARPAPTRRGAAHDISTLQRPGRPALPPGELQDDRIHERVTKAQKIEYKARGGKAWLARELGRVPRK